MKKIILAVALSFALSSGASAGFNSEWAKEGFFTNNAHVMAVMGFDSSD